MRVRKRELFVKFQADRGTQLAAMIAYYALLAFVPLTFLTISFLAAFGRADESAYLVGELSRMFPESTNCERIGSSRSISRIQRGAIWSDCGSVMCRSDQDVRDGPRKR